MKKIALVWWWTWWHITPLLAIYNTIKSNKNLSFIWIWEKDSLEEKIAKQNWIKFFWVKSWKLRRYFSFKTFIEPFKIIYGVFESILILKKEKISIIFSKWGYVSLPVSIAWWILKIKLFLHESDTIPGLANRIVAKFATKIFLWFESAKKYFKKDNYEIVWQILNPDLFVKSKIKQTKNTNLLVIWWSQWSSRIFDFLLNNIKKFEKFEINIVLWSLNIWFKNKFKKYNFISTYDFINHDILKDLYSNADIAITRAWASVLAELEAFGIKMIIIPLWESANNHQYFNALEYEKKWNILILEKDLNKNWLKEILKFEKFKKIKNKFTNKETINKILFSIFEN